MMDQGVRRIATPILQKNGGAIVRLLPKFSQHPARPRRSTAAVTPYCAQRYTLLFPAARGARTHPASSPAAAAAQVAATTKAAVAEINS